MHRLRYARWVYIRVKRVRGDKINMYHKKGEIQFEKEFIETLTRNGWTYNTELENATPEQLQDHFRDLLNQNNYDVLNGHLITDSEMGEIMRFIGGKTPTEANKFLTGTYESVIPLTRENPELGIADLKVFWRDAIAGGAMHYEVIRQAIRPGNADDASDHNRRFDVTLLFNGLPLIQVEEKRVDVDIKEAANQIVKYKAEYKYDGLYAMVQIFVTLKENAARYFANEKSAELFNNKFFFEWLDQHNKPVRNWKQFTEEFLKIPMAHNLISNYTITDGKVLKVLRPYQIHAVAAIRDAFSKHEDGYIWHATGSGKTLTAYKVATLLQRDPANQVIFLSDRKELDNQSGENFAKFSTNSDDTIFETNNTSELMKRLKNTKTGVITTTINKMKIVVERNRDKVENGKKEPLAKLMQKRLVFIVDEAHRSQFGEMQRVIRQAFPKQNWYGFTGTPIFDFNKTQQDQTTESQFGPELHRYNIGNALNDGAILPFNSEYVSLMQVIDETTGKTLEEDEVADEAYTGDNDTAKQYRLKVAEWIIKNWKRKSESNRFNAILAANDIPQALAYYQLFKELQAKGTHSLKIAITYSLNENGDENQFQRAGLEEAMRDYSLRYTNSETAFSMDNSQVYIDDVAKRSARTEEPYKNQAPEEDIDLTIVVARLLTGFDAPRLNTLYLDKLLQYQGLIQGFARTNRVHDRFKAQGNIVMFRRPKLMRERTQDAFEKYAGEGSFKKVFRPEFEQMQTDFTETVKNLRRYVPTADDANDLQDASQSDQIEFLTRFRDLAKKLQYIASYSEFDWDHQEEQYGLTHEEYDYYQGAFKNVKDAVVKDSSADDEEEAAVLKFDFDDVVTSELMIDREYILSLATKYIQNVDNLLAEQEFKAATEKWAKSGNSQEVEDIRQFVAEERQLKDIPEDYDASARYAARQSRRKQHAVLDFVDEYGLDATLFNRLVTEYEATGEFSHEQELKRTADILVAEENGHQYLNMLDFKGSIQRTWREFIAEDLVQYNIGGK